MKRRSPDLIFLAFWGIGVLFFAAAVAWPLVAGLLPALANAGDLLATLDRTPLWTGPLVVKSLILTLGWGILISLGACFLGVLPGLALGRCGDGRSARWLTALLLSALCLPSYLLYWVWGLWRWDDSAFVTWLRADAGRADRFDLLLLWWALSAWGWPVVALSTAAAIRRIPRNRQDLLQTDGAGRLRRAWILLIEARGGIVLGVGLVFLSTLTSFAAFDLATLDTFGNLLRRLWTEVSGPPVALASLPMLAMSLVSAWLIMTLIGRAPVEPEWASLRSEKRAWVIPLLWLTITVGGPVVLMLGRLDGVETFQRLGPIEGKTIAASLGWALVAGACFTLLTLALAAGWARPERKWQRITSVMALGWVWIGLTPASAIGSLLIVSYNHAAFPFGAIYSSPTIVIIGHLARFGMISVLVARWITVNEGQTTNDLRRIDGATALPAWLVSGGSNLWRPIVAAGGLGALLSLGEVSTTMIVLPAGYQSLTERLLNKMHYAREDSAVATCLIMMGIIFLFGIVCALAVQRWRWPMRNRAVMIPLLLAILIPLSGCERPAAKPDGRLNTQTIFGTTGRGHGEFMYPRAAAYDVNRGLYVIDKSGRIQRYKANGTFDRQWILPSFDHGYPSGISVHPKDGRVFVPDTHEHRILIYSPDGEILQRFGSRGQGPGQFLFPTDVAFAPDGMLYISEYGGNDRIQAFTADGEFLFEFGSEGSEWGQFRRPQSVVFDAKRNELWIADACNHRLVITTPTGEWITTVGQPGTGPGELSYPYGLVLQLDGTILVAEYGNNRVQHLDREGRSLGVFGVAGVARGELKYPWAITAGPRQLFVIDSGNNRVQVIPRPEPDPHR